MPETKSWSGDAHNAATAMFDRAKKQTDDFSKYTTAVGGALSSSAGQIGGARTALLNKAADVDASGQLHVSDQWVVLITGAQMTAEQAAALEKRAQSEQVAVNAMLLAVGAADDNAAAKVMSAAQPHGFEAPNPGSPGNILLPGLPKPGDEVPNPSNPVGMMQQGILRDTDMSQTVRDTTVETKHDPATGELVSTTTTVYMQDGSKHVKVVNAQSSFRDRGPATVETYYGKDGQVIAETSFVTFNDLAPEGYKNAKVTTTKFADQTAVTLIEHANGNVTGTIVTPNGGPTDVPLDFFNHPILTGAGGGLSALEKLSTASDNIRAGAKYGGPALGIATALWDVAVADSSFKRCVAAVEGATSVTAGTLGGIVASPSTPLGAAAVSILAGAGGQALGNWIGNTFCPR
ncbi:hypothetical protein [Mycolicibacterium houstonense]|uniref:hypothetical protein n=1 Tax=Mycolicibacterium houstonense TaxID=146021 RepID=UPI000939B912|nr:hypothetical protein [Mycolicibacterium houstonense]